MAHSYRPSSEERTTCESAPHIHPSRNLYKLLPSGEEGDNLIPMDMDWYSIRIQSLIGNPSEFKGTWGFWEDQKGKKRNVLKAYYSWHFLLDWLTLLAWDSSTMDCEDSEDRDWAMDIQVTLSGSSLLILLIVVIDDEDICPWATISECSFVAFG